MNKFEELLQKYGKTVEDITFEYKDLSDEEIEEIVEDMKDDFTEHEIEIFLLETGRDNETKNKVR